MQDEVGARGFVEGGCVWYASDTCAEHQWLGVPKRTCVQRELASRAHSRRASMLNLWRRQRLRMRALHIAQAMPEFTVVCITNLCVTIQRVSSFSSPRNSNQTYDMYTQGGEWTCPCETDSAVFDITVVTTPGTQLQACSSARPSVLVRLLMSLEVPTRCTRR